MKLLDIKKDLEEYSNLGDVCFISKDLANSRLFDSTPPDCLLFKITGNRGLDSAYIYRQGDMIHTDIKIGGADQHFSKVVFDRKNNKLRITWLDHNLKRAITFKKLIELFIENGEFTINAPKYSIRSAKCDVKGTSPIAKVDCSAELTDNFVLFDPDFEIYVGEFLEKFFNLASNMRNLDLDRLFQDLSISGELIANYLYALYKTGLLEDRLKILQHSRNAMAEDEEVYYKINHLLENDKCEFISELIETGLNDMIKQKMSLVNITLHDKCKL